MARRSDVSLTYEAVIDAAVAIVADEGADALGMRPVARALGVRASALYHHVDDRDALRLGVALWGWSRLVDALPAPSDDLQESLLRGASAYRSFALEHPHLYEVMTRAPLSWDDPRVPALTARALVKVGHAASQIQDGVHLARSLRSFMHGFVLLELEGQFTHAHSAESTLRWMVERLTAGMG